MQTLKLVETPRLILRELTDGNGFTRWTDEEIESFFGSATDDVLKEEEAQFAKGICSWYKENL